MGGKTSSPEIISTRFVRPELTHGPLHFHRANPHEHLSLVLWVQQLMTRQTERVTATVRILQQSFHTKAAEHRKGAPVPALPPHFWWFWSQHFMTIPTLSPAFEFVQSIQVTYPVGSTGTFQCQSDTTIIYCHCMRWGATPSRDRLPSTYNHDRFVWIRWSLSLFCAKFPSVWA